MPQDGVIAVYTVIGQFVPYINNRDHREDGPDYEYEQRCHQQQGVYNYFH